MRARMAIPNPGPVSGSAPSWASCIVAGYRARNAASRLSAIEVITIAGIRNVARRAHHLRPRPPVRVAGLSPARVGRAPPAVASGASASRLRGPGRGTLRAFDRIGDNGMVGGQTLLGLLQIDSLLRLCEAEGIRVAVWPFDGLSLEMDASSGAHVMIEPYPTAVRNKRVAQSGSRRSSSSVSVVRMIKRCSHGSMMSIA